MNVADELDLRGRLMAALASETAEHGGSLTRAQLSRFAIGDTTRRLVDQSRGIWNPRDLNGTLSIVSSPDGPYADRETEGGLLRYDYRAGSDDGDNAKLRRARELGLPLILLRKIERGVYVPVFPVYVVADDRAARQFVIALDESLRFLADPLHPSEAERRYAERVVRQRLHQPEFRGRVIRAYDMKCAVCRLRHGSLLDAAHIIADTAEGGTPIVSNGLSLCKIHHAAYDRDLLGVTPDYVVEINRDLLEEVDGPMLQHGLKAMHGQPLTLPATRTQWPDRERLAVRYDAFAKAH